MTVIHEYADILTPPMLLASNKYQLYGPNLENLIDDWLPRRSYGTASLRRVRSRPRRRTATTSARTRTTRP